MGNVLLINLRILKKIYFTCKTQDQKHIILATNNQEIVNRPPRPTPLNATDN